MTRVKPRVVKDTDRVRKIQLALEGRRLKGTNFRDLATDYGIMHSTLCDADKHTNGSRQYPHWLNGP